MTLLVSSRDPISEEGRRLRGRRAMIALITPFSAAGAMSYPLIALLMEREGWSEFWIGLNSALAAIAIMITGYFGARVLAATGLNRLLAASLIAGGLCLSVFSLTSDYILWSALRVTMGAAFGAVYFAAEYWVVTASNPQRRGRNVAHYAVGVAVGSACGPVILWFTGVDGLTPFLLAGALMAVSLTPLALARDAAPAVERDKARQDAVRFFFTAPSLLFGVALFGAIEFGAFALLPVWALREGMSEASAVAVVATVAIGAFLMQPLVGAALDRSTPRRVLAISSGVTLIIALATPVIVATPPFLFVMMFFWGGLSIALYTTSLTAIGHRYAGADLSAANAAIILAYGLGALVGPLSVGAAMDVFGADGLPLMVACLTAPYLALVILRSQRDGEHARSAPKA